MLNLKCNECLAEFKVDVICEPPKGFSFYQCLFCGCEDLIDADEAVTMEIVHAPGISPLKLITRKVDD